MTHIMNPRLQELMYQAGIVSASSRGDITTDKLQLGKFAELSINECSQLTLDYRNEQHYNGWIEYRDEIRYHFNITE